MSNTNTGGPAFPAVIPLEHSEQQGKDYPNYTEAGMTLRDYFAAKAMQGFCANPANRDALPKEISRGAYTVADAMLKARQD